VEVQLRVDAHIGLWITVSSQPGLGSFGGIPTHRRLQ